MSIFASVMQQPKPLYEILEYIQSTGTQYIDSGVKALKGYTSTIRFQATSMPTSGAYKEGWVMSVYASTSSMWRCGINGDILFTNGGFAYSQSSPLAEIVGTGTSPSDFTYSLIIFGQNENGSIQHVANSKYKLWYLKISDANGKPVRDYVPARRIADSAIGLYDRVEKKFYENAGTGAFAAGSATSEVVMSVNEPTLVTREVAALVARGEKAVTPVLVEDDFTADTLDKDKWTCNGSDTITAAGCFHFPAFSTNTPIYGSCLLSKATYDGGDVDVTFTVKAIGTGRRSEANFGIFAGDWPPGGDGNYNSSPPDYAVMVEPSSYDNNTGMRLFIKGAFSKVLTSTIYTSNFTLRFVYMSTAKNLKIYINGALLYDETQDLSSYVGRYVAFAHASYYSGFVDIDGIRAVNPSVAVSTVPINRSVGKLYRAVGGVVRQVFPDVLAASKFIDGPRISDNLQFMLSGDGSGGRTPGAHSSVGNGIRISHNQCGGSMFITTEKVNVSNYSKLSARAIAYVNNSRMSMDFCVMLFTSMPADLNRRTFYSYYNWYFTGVGGTKLVEAASELIYPYNVGVPCSAMLDLSKIYGEYYIALEVVNNHNGSGNGSITIDSFMLE